MVSTPAGKRRICVAYDIAGYSSRDLHGQFDAQTQLAAILAAACASANLSESDYGIQQQGDGGLALLPTGGDVDDPRLLDSFLRTIDVELLEVNRFRARDKRLRLRVALHEGVVFAADHGYVGDAIVEVFRMCDATPTRESLVTNPDANMVIVVADRLYTDVFRYSLHGMPGEAFVRHTLQVKSFSGDGWIYVPGGNAAPATGAEATAPSATNSGERGTGASEVGEAENGNRSSIPEPIDLLAVLGEEPADF